MANFSDLTKKLDIQGLVDTVKSAIGGSTVAKAPEGDEIAAKFVALSQLIQNLASVHAEQAKAIANINNQLNILSKDWQLMQGATAAEAATTDAAQTPAASDATPEASKEETEQEKK